MYSCISYFPSKYTNTKSEYMYICIFTFQVSILYMKVNTCTVAYLAFQANIQIQQSEYMLLVYFAFKASVLYIKVNTFTVVYLVFHANIQIEKGE